MSVRGRIKPNTCSGRLALTIIFVLGIALICTGVRYLYGGNGAEEPYPWKGHYSQFTLLTMTYDARLWNLKMYVKHYSRCPSVKEIVVVWNKGKPPELSDLESAVPVRIRVEEKNSLNNRFNLMMLNKASEIVGFYPRLTDGSPLKYRDEKYARSHGGYNMILTGAAFIDSEFAFKRYWSEEAKAGREVVDKYFNSISRNTQVHYRIRSDCLHKFSQMYGNLASLKSKFNGRSDGWDV
ncbi:hypothetical protein AQUCO_00901029v1 [Aquilegia coerulea]|uniref:Glycosyl transferase 64 domain-containing protein n=1 Tax=Aquilegia coerulea TaxID=218851 RepID=A0A2G5EGG0_AQUCA|nr:hypothetical protein AQUCO_00901029v1 [Aquilegia coerulea]